MSKREGIGVWESKRGKLAAESRKRIELRERGDLKRNTLARKKRCRKGQKVTTKICFQGDGKGKRRGN